MCDLSIFLNCLLDVDFGFSNWCHCDAEEVVEEEEDQE